jgi:aldehyde dehydrogenase (NAD+)
VNAERVRATAGAAGKRLRVDAGGTAPARVGPGDDLAAVVAEAAVRVCAHAGQVPRLPATVLVPPHRYAEAVQVAVRTMDAIGVGDPTDPATVCGPVLSPVQRDRVLRYLRLAESEGGHCDTGGHALQRDGGWWIAPTVVSGVTLRSRVVKEEILGPVLLVVSDRP